MTYEQLREALTQAVQKPQNGYALITQLETIINQHVSELVEACKPETFSRNQQYTIGFNDAVAQYEKNLKEALK